MLGLGIEKVRISRVKIVTVKKIRKGISLACCLCIVAVQAPAAEVQAGVPEQVQPFMESIASYSADLAISDSGSASVTAYVIAKGNAASTYVKATLQKKSENGWVDVKSWKKTGNGGYTGVIETYPVSRGKYRVKAAIQADSETRNVITVTRTY